MLNPERESSTGMWALFISVVALQIVLAMIQREQVRRLESAEQRIEELSESLVGRMALQEEQHNGCAAALADWQRWLDLRAEGYGAAWFLRQKPEETAP